MTPHNPLSEPLFARTATVVGAALLILLVGALRREWRRRRRPDERALLVPVLTASAIIVIFLVSLFAGGLLLTCFAATVASVGAAEYSVLARLGRVYAGLLVAWSVAGAALATASDAGQLLLLPVTLLLTATAVPIVSGQVEGAHLQVGAVVFGYVYIGMPMAYLVLVRTEQPWGLQLLLTAVAAAWLADACAYLVGSKVGGPKLAPRVSPNKTWSGLAGSLAGAILGVLLVHRLLALPGRLGALMLLGVVIAASAVWGDLVESLVKRDFGVKDAGVVLPGFGGVLDRFDSLFVTIPSTYYLVLGGHLLDR